jgi:hypothetical protein
MRKIYLTPRKELISNEFYPDSNVKLGVMQSAGDEEFESGLFPNF